MSGRELPRRAVLQWTGAGVVGSPLAVSELVDQQASGELQVTIRQITRPEFPDVDVFATVQDAAGDPIGGLTADSFAITEDGTSQTIRSVTAGDSLETGRARVSVSLVIDRSGSMQGRRIGDAKRAAIQFVEQLAANDEAQVVAFDDTVEIRQRWTSDAGTLTAAIDAIDTDGQTALWDATITGITETASRIGRTAVIVLTDGQDNESAETAQDAIDAAEADGVPVYTIGLGSSIRVSPLRRLANETGGAYYEAPTSTDLVAIYDQISRSIASEYRITYRTSNTATDGTTRTVDLTANDGSASGTDTGRYAAPCAPIPDAAFDYAPTTPAASETVTFDASGSTSNGGSIVAYRWDFTNDGVVDATGQTVDHSYPDAGNYEARLTVEKGCGVTDTTTASIDVGDSAGTQTRSLMITANRPTTYTVAADGLTPDSIGGTFSCDNDETIVRNADGTVTASDETGPAPNIASPTTFLGDRYRFTGSITDLTLSPRQQSTEVYVYLDEGVVPRSAAVGASSRSGDPRTLMIAANGPVEYSLTVDGDLEPQTLAGDFSSEDDDTVTQRTDGAMVASDETGPAPTNAAPTTYLGDRYLVTGNVRELSLSPSDPAADVNVYLDEELVDPDRFGNGGGATPPATTRTLMIAANGPADYAIAGEGDIQPQTLAGDFSGDDDDVPSQNPDGTLTASDQTGPAPANAGPNTFLGDRFRFSGSASGFQVSPVEQSTTVNVYLDEETVPPSRVAGFADQSGQSHTVMIAANGPTDYTLTVDGELEPQTLAGDFSGEDDDQPTRNGRNWRVSDQTGPAPDNAAPLTYLGDRYLVSGSVTDFRVDGVDQSTDVNVYLDEEPVTPADVLDVGSS